MKLTKPGFQTLFAITFVTLSTACGSPVNPSSYAIEVSETANVKETPSKQRQARANQTYADVQALVNLGARVTGTDAAKKASVYLAEQYRQAGYKTKIQTFTYTKFVDLESNIIVDGKTIKGYSLKGTIPGKVKARLVAIPNFGRTSDFIKASQVKDAVAIIKRGEIKFAEKVRNAEKAGASAVVIFNNKSEHFRSGALTETSKIPVLAISGEEGEKLVAQTRKTPLNVTLNVNGRNQKVTGRNVIAHLAGVTQPKIIVGGHYDSVEDAPGANDNASGTAVVLSLARNLKNSPLARRAWFVAFDGEEDGLHGSQAFVEEATPQFLTSLKGMLNFDMVGINKQLQIGGTPSLTALAQIVEPTIQLFGSSSLNGASSDHASFAAKNIPVMFFHRGLEPNYHSPNDKTVDPKLLDQTTEAGIDIIKRLLQG
ncbi:putative aminopeptidase [Calothrix sp. NIES-4101]|nr:putative aminopeptidase [Calothrix sp. NIES-4101]